VNTEFTESTFKILMDNINFDKIQYLELEVYPVDLMIDYIQRENIENKK